MNSPALETSTEPGTLPRVDKDAARKPGKFQISPEVKASLERTQSQDDGSGYVSDRHNSSGAHVKFWQGLLQIPETGKVDKVTTEAIKEMQRSLGVADDGVIGPRTFRAFALQYQGGSDQVDGLFFQDFQVKLLSQAEYDEMLAASSSRRRNSILGVDLSGLMNLSGSAVFEKLMPMIFKVEGWLSNDADDRGGVTLAGITWGAYKSYMQGKGITLSQSEAESQLYEYSKQPREVFAKIASDIYLQNYWNPSGCEKLPPLIAAVHFDAAVNHGVGGAEKLLSRTLEKAGVSLESLSGISEEEQTRIAKIYIDERKEYYNDIISNRPSQEKFRNGWMNRLDIVSNSLNSVHGLGLPSQSTHESDQIFQDKRDNCGPTAVAMAISELTGSDPKTLRDEFTRQKGRGAMSWSLPRTWASQHGLKCEEVSNPSAEQIKAWRDKGISVVLSCNNLVTKGGHIINVGDVSSVDGKLYFENKDPNRKNVEKKGLGTLSEDQIEKASRHAFLIYK